MQKMQILFPEPQLERLRRIARDEDRPVSELVRLAVDAYLARHGSSASETREAPPTYSCGEILAEPRSLRELARGRAGDE